jgi:hypothetical protein
MKNAVFWNLTASGPWYSHTPSYPRSRHPSYSHTASLTRRRHSLSIHTASPKTGVYVVTAVNTSSLTYARFEVFTADLHSLTWKLQNGLDINVKYITLCSSALSWWWLYPSKSYWLLYAPLGWTLPINIISNSCQDSHGSGPLTSAVPCSLVGIYQLCEGSCCFHLQGQEVGQTCRNSEVDGGFVVPCRVPVASARVCQTVTDCASCEVRTRFLNTSSKQLQFKWECRMFPVRSELNY